MTTILDTKIGKVKIVPNVSDLVTTNAPDTKVGEVENKVPDHAKYITTREFNKFAGTKIDKRPEQANFVGKNVFGDDRLFKTKLFSISISS